MVKPRGSASSNRSDEETRASGTASEEGDLSDTESMSTRRLSQSLENSPFEARKRSSLKASAVAFVPWADAPVFVPQDTFVAMPPPPPGLQIQRTALSSLSSKAKPFVPSWSQ